MSSAITAIDKPVGLESDRLTLRLPTELLGWVRRQGGSSFVRDLLAQHHSFSVGSIKPGPDLEVQWKHLAYELEALDEERKLLRDEESVLDRTRERLRDERRLLEERSEQLADEWFCLEEAQDDLQLRVEELGALLVRLSLTPSIFFDIVGLTLRQTRGCPLV
jgi:hypothetical protein